MPEKKFNQIVAKCENCELLNVPVADVTLIHETSHNRYLYTFVCPKDAQITLQTIPSGRADVFRISGVKQREVDFTAELINEGLPTSETILRRIDESEISDFIINLNLIEASEIVSMAASS